jgi:thiol-disulfide isomerase/thioredoxin
MSVQLLSILLAVTPLFAREPVSETIAAYSKVRCLLCGVTCECNSARCCDTQDYRLELVISNRAIEARSDRKKFRDLRNDPTVNGAFVRCTSMEYRGCRGNECDEGGFILHNATVTLKQGESQQIVFDAPSVVYDDKLNTLHFRASDHEPVRIRSGNDDSLPVCIKSATVDITPALQDTEMAIDPGMSRQAPANSEGADLVDSQSESAATSDSTADTEFLFFTASYCQPCQRMTPVITRVQQDIRIRIVDITNNGDLARSCKVDRIPQLVLVENGNAVCRLVGINTESDVRLFLANPKRSGTD